MERRRERGREHRQAERAPWTPKTDLGRRVAAGEVTSLDEIVERGRPILETQIVDALLPDLKEEVLEVEMMFRQTKLASPSAWPQGASGPFPSPTR